MKAYALTVFSIVLATSAFGQTAPATPSTPNAAAGNHGCIKPELPDGTKKISDRDYIHARTKIIEKNWFLDFLKDGSFGYLLVCHDRYFLDKVCLKTFELSLGKLTIYHGNYSSRLWK